MAAASESTCWTLILGAAGGRREDQEVFTKRYKPLAEAYLRARWRSAAQREEIEDATQEVLLHCLREGGALVRADPSYGGGFRAFFYGVVRNVARTIEHRWDQDRRRLRPLDDDSGEASSGEISPSAAYDAAWARAVLQEAVDLLSERALVLGAAARRRIELLQARFADGLTIAEVAKEWSVGQTVLYHEFAKVKEEFKSALREILRQHGPDRPEAVEDGLECLRLHFGCGP